MDVDHSSNCQESAGLTFVLDRPVSKVILPQEALEEGTESSWEKSAAKFREAKPAPEEKDEDSGGEGGPPPLAPRESIKQPEQTPGISTLNLLF